MISTATRAPAEHDRLAAGPEERQRPAMGEGQGRAAGAGGDGSSQRRIDEEDVALARRRAVAVDEDRRPAGEASRPARPGSRSSPSSRR